MKIIKNLNVLLLLLLIVSSCSKDEVTSNETDIEQQTKSLLEDNIYKDYITAIRELEIMQYGRFSEFQNYEEPISEERYYEIFQRKFDMADAEKKEEIGLKLFGFEDNPEGLKAIIARIDTSSKYLDEKYDFTNNQDLIESIQNSSLFQDLNEKASEVAYQKCSTFSPFFRFGACLGPCARGLVSCLGIRATTGIAFSIGSCVVRDNFRDRIACLAGSFLVNVSSSTVRDCNGAAMNCARACLPASLDGRAEDGLAQFLPR